MKRHIPILLGACSTLPSSGPTGPAVLRTSAEDKQLGLSVVEVDSLVAIPPVQADEKGSTKTGMSLISAIVLGVMKRARSAFVPRSSIQG